MHLSLPIVDPCLAGLSNAFEYSFPLLSFTEINKSYDLIRVESGKPSLVDIRDVF